MSFGTYRQYDSRWGKKNYNGSSTYAQAGCGATACANILYAINPSITPLTTGKYMQSHGYAIRNNGTAWAGIPACLKAFGATDVRQVDKMSDVFSLMSKGYVGVFLFRAGTRGGVTWTTSGHYIAVTGYKHANGKHYIRTFDSGGRKHDGFYCYETNMKGLLPRIWLCKVTPEVIKKPSGKYAGTIPSPTLKKPSKGDNTKNLQKFLNWYHPAWKLAVDGVFGSATEYALEGFQRTEGLTADGIYGKNSYAKAKAYEYVPPKAEPQKVEPPKVDPPKTTAKKGYTGTFPKIPKGKIAECTRSVNGMRKHGLISGDYILRFKSEERRYKMCKFSRATVGNKKISYSNHPKFEDKVKAFGYNLAKVKALKTSANCSNFINGCVLAVTGKYVRDLGAKHNKKYLTKTNYFTSHKYSKGALLAGDICGTSKHTWMILQGSAISVGCEGTNVKRWQSFLRWYGYNIAVDGDFGMGTLDATKKFQKANGLTVDGIVGNKTIAKAKAVRK